MPLKAVPKKRRNIPFIFGDDIGITQVNACARRLMGQTPKAPDETIAPS